jgi:hypothetical protein
MQKILTKGFDRRDVYFLKRRPNVGELHWNAGEGATSAAKPVSLFAKSCEQNMQQLGFLFTSYSQAIS